MPGPGRMAAMVVLSGTLAACHGTPKPRSSAVRSIAANHATDGHGLELTRSGGVWRISGGGV